MAVSSRTPPTFAEVAFPSLIPVILSLYKVKAEVRDKKKRSQ
ncbi:MAG: hypothetical protein ACW97Z_13030 [Candidatus Hodarchaeales archaeon]|jgi:hypothetical protein